MARHRNANWDLTNPVNSWEEVHAALLMDIRDELQAIRGILSCPNVQKAALAAQDAAKATKRIDKRLSKRIKL
jgi:hypothetical protein